MRFGSHVSAKVSIGRHHVPAVGAETRRGERKRQVLSEPWVTRADAGGDGRNARLGEQAARACRAGEIAAVSRKQVDAGVVAHIGCAEWHGLLPERVHIHHHRLRRAAHARSETAETKDRQERRRITRHPRSGCAGRSRRPTLGSYRNSDSEIAVEASRIARPAADSDLRALSAATGRGVVDAAIRLIANSALQDWEEDLRRPTPSGLGRGTRSRSRSGRQCRPRAADHRARLDRRTAPGSRPSAHRSSTSKGCRRLGRTLSRSTGRSFSRRRRRSSSRARPR